MRAPQSGVLTDLEKGRFWLGAVIACQRVILLPYTAHR
jgi:hypothetical protein